MMPPSRTKKMGVLGGAGLLGSDLVAFFGAAYDTVSITRENYADHVGGTFDVLVNANGNSRRFFANEHPQEDFRASVASVADSLFDFSFDTYAYISSSDVYGYHARPETAREDVTIEPARLSPYGFHKRLSELLVEKYAPKFIICRCSMMLGRNLKKGPVYDLLHGTPAFIAESSRLQMITAPAVAAALRALLEKGAANGCFNVGGEGTVRMPEIAEIIGKPLVVRDGAPEQVYEMSVEKIKEYYPLKTSKDYLREFEISSAPV